MFNTRETSVFSFNNTSFILKKPVPYSLEHRNNLWVYECPRYGLHTFSEDRHEAFCQLGEKFDFLYEGLIHEPDENFTQQAVQKLKNQYKRRFNRLLNPEIRCKICKIWTFWTACQDAIELRDVIKEDIVRTECLPQ